MQSCSSFTPSRATTILVLVSIFSMAACQDEPSSPPSTPPIAAQPSAWPSSGDSNVVGVDAGDPAMNAAIASARQTAEDARVRFQNMPEEVRIGWWIKWGAPTVEGGIEHVWVQPMNWSPFRIEGILSSSAVSELACGKSAGEIVSFPIEELSDWLHFYSGAAEFDMESPHEGGFTVKVLNAQQGVP